MSWKYKTEPAYPAVSLSYLKSHVHIDTDIDDTVIPVMIEAASEHIEDFTNMQPMYAVVEEYLDEVPEMFYPSRMPMRDVVAITYTDTDGDEQTLAASKYSVDTVGNRVKIIDPPSVDADALNVFKVEYSVGYSAIDANEATQQSNVPDRFKQCVAMMVSRFLVYREDFMDDGYKAPQMVRYMMNLLRMRKLPNT